MTKKAREKIDLYRQHATFPILAAIKLEHCVVVSVEFNNDVDKAGVLQLSVEAFTRDTNRLGNPVNMHVVPPPRFSIPVAMAGSHEHLFRIHAWRMSFCS